MKARVYRETNTVSFFITPRKTNALMYEATPIMLQLLLVGLLFSDSCNNINNNSSRFDNFLEFTLISLVKFTIDPQVNCVPAIYLQLVVEVISGWKDFSVQHLLKRV